MTARRACEDFLRGFLGGLAAWFALITACASFLLLWAGLMLVVTAPVWVPVLVVIGFIRLIGG